MRIFIKPVLIDALKSFSSLAHGSSPRYFESENGEKSALLLGPIGDTGSLPAHREIFLRSLDIGSDEVYLVRQIHGDRVYVLDDAALSGGDLSGVEADAIVTRLAGRPIGVLTADCIPIIVYDALLHVVGVVHAGRKGTAENILFKTIGALRKSYGSRPENVFMGMGPGIGGCCYEVDDLCVRPFREKFGTWRDFVRKSADNKYMLDLFRANEEDGRNAGIPPKNIFCSGECTACQVDKFFSYRKEGRTGRMMTLAMLR